MASTEGRRSFLLSITLSELSFIMFFLLMVVSASILQKTSLKLDQQIQQKNQLQAELVKARDESGQTFKRLQLLESRLMQAGGFSARPSSGQLDELFSRLQEATAGDELRQANTRLQRELESLKPYQHLAEVLGEKGEQYSSSQQVVEQLLQQVDSKEKEQQLLKGRVAYMQKKLQGNGLDHPPCWADPQSGAVEYLYSMTLYEHKIGIESAWPVHRLADLRLIPGAQQLVGQSLTVAQLQQQVKPVFAWSKTHDCRHFVRIKDDRHTSKEAFKRQMLAVEAYFYKYLQR